MWGGIHKGVATAPSELNFARHPVSLQQTMVPLPNDPMSIFAYGKLKAGTYKVQNLASETYLEILERSRVLCCRPATVLSPEDASVNLDVLLASRTLNVPNTFTVGIPTVRVGVQDQKGAHGRLFCDSLIMTNISGGGISGRPQKAGPILQRDWRAILRIWEHDLGYGVPCGVEGRTRA